MLTVFSVHGRSLVFGPAGAGEFWLVVQVERAGCVLFVRGGGGVTEVAQIEPLTIKHSKGSFGKLSSRDHTHLAEHNVHALLNNPFIVPLSASFHSPDKLYLIVSVAGLPLFYNENRATVYERVLHAPLRIVGLLNCDPAR
ncbi:hypothetical protein EXIGLDRAFT_793765 [Exidia glandulosa HHB12029]|uniref:Uncharacterized protein n=1 Tax=Exidia glandulosa HHB12029 TaxID=1314781 RepID=A0A166ACR9_EXIGL|nr:hypothetical protein EXIGLDRAFT_793765 [Exidia glandulosa HHB12029]